MSLYNATNESVAPGTPTTGRKVLYPKSGGWYYVDDAGVEHTIVDYVLGDARYVTPAQLESQTFTAFTTGGTSTAYTLTPSPAIGSLVAGQRFRVLFNATAGTTPTLSISGQTAKNIKLYDYTGAKQSAGATSIIANMLTDVEYDGTDYVILNPLPSSTSSTTATTKIPTITATVAANALTIGMSSTYLDFRSATIGSGTISTILAAPSNLVVPSTATLGTVNAVQSRLVVLAINNAGTIELAVVNIAGGNDLSETGIINTTTIAGGSNTANVIYSTAGRTGVAYREVGYVESTQATAGIWATAPSTIQGAGGNALASIGGGRTWQAITIATGTTYYNTWGKEIDIALIGTPSTLGAFPYFTVGGYAVYPAGGLGTSAAQQAATVKVPTGQSFVLNISAGTFTSITASVLR